MNKLLIIFVLANLMTLVRGYVWQQMLQQNLMGDVKLMAPSEADKKFKRCCEIEIGNGYCTNQMCSLSKISRMTHRAFVSTVIKCKGQVRKIWRCASKMTDQTACCNNRGVPGHCHNYCNGLTELNLKEPDLLCLLFSKQIIQCFKENLLS